MRWRFPEYRRKINAVHWSSSVWEVGFGFFWISFERSLFFTWDDRHGGRLSHRRLLWFSIHNMGDIDRRGVSRIRRAALVAGCLRGRSIGFLNFAGSPFVSLRR